MDFDKPKENVTNLNASAGASWNTGNTRAYQINLGSGFLLVRNPHSFAAAVAFAYGRADVAGDESDTLRETVKNLNANARYSFFVSTLDSLFIGSAVRWDPFAGIDYRVQGLAGYGRYFIREDKQRFWAEFGYDLTVDDYRQLPDQDPPDPSHDVIHSARGFIGYENELNEGVTYNGGVEALVDVAHPKAVRINFDNALRSSLSNTLKLELKFRLAWDATARERRGARPLDTATLVSLLVTLL